MASRAQEAARSEGAASPEGGGWRRPGTGFGDGMTRAERSAERKRIMPPPPPQRDLPTSPETPRTPDDAAALANFDERLQTLEEKVTTGFAGLTRSLALIQLDAGGGGMGGGPGLPAPADAGGPPKNVYEGEWERAACVCACVR